MAGNQIAELEMQIVKLIGELNELRKTNRGAEVPNYRFRNLEGEISLLNLFGTRNQLLLIHNMGQACRYCTLWADGFNGMLAHLESAISVVLVSKDSPETQRLFANSRGWKFRLASHGGEEYIREQSVMVDSDNYPGAVVYERDGDVIYRKNECVFGPGDIYCSMWSLLGLAGLGADDWTPQFTYWRRPETLEDGGKNMID